MIYSEIERVAAYSNLKQDAQTQNVDAMQSMSVIKVLKLEAVRQHYQVQLRCVVSEYAAHLCFH